MDENILDVLILKNRYQYYKSSWKYIYSTLAPEFILHILMAYFTPYFSLA